MNHVIRVLSKHKHIKFVLDVQYMLHTHRIWHLLVERPWPWPKHPIHSSPKLHLSDKSVSYDQACDLPEPPRTHPCSSKPCTCFHVTIDVPARDEPPAVQRHMLIRRLVLSDHVYLLGSDVTRPCGEHNKTLRLARQATSTPMSFR